MNNVTLEGQLRLRDRRNFKFNYEQKHLLPANLKIYFFKENYFQKPSTKT